MVTNENYDARVLVRADMATHEVPRRLFGSFVEHMGRTVYTGIFEPGHPEADAQGFRSDVAALVREMGVTLVRYPGGNFVSGYDWKDGIGPVQDRPRRLDLAWHSTETNEFGVDEFMDWARLVDVEPNLAVNLGTGGIRDALDLLEYANHPGESSWSDLRRQHGHTEPFAVSMWCLGNEMDGPWQTGHMTAHEYGRVAAEVGRAMRQFDPSLELVACGSSSRSMPTFGAWEATVLELCYEQVDYISAHAYYNEEWAGSLQDYLASSVDMDHFIEEVVATADSVRARKRSDKVLEVAFDEWNVWYQQDLAPPEDSWPVAPRISEDPYTVVDAVVVGSLLITLLRHSDRVTSACIAQLVNCLAPIHSEPDGPAWRMPTFFPFAHAARTAGCRLVPVDVESPEVESQAHGAVPVVDATATHDPDTGLVTVFAINRSVEHAVELQIDLEGFGDEVRLEHVEVADDDIRATNTASDPERVAPRRVVEPAVGAPPGSVHLRPVSWNVIRLATSPGS